MGITKIASNLGDLKAMFKRRSGHMLAIGNS